MPNTFLIGRTLYKVGDKIGDWEAIKVEHGRDTYEIIDIVTFKKGDVEKTIFGTFYQTEDSILRILNANSGGKRRKTQRRKTQRRKTHKRRN